MQIPSREVLQFDLSNLTPSRRRTSLTILSIAMSIFIFAALFTPSFVDEVMAWSALSPRLVCHGKAGLSLDFAAFLAA